MIFSSFFLKLYLNKISVTRRAGIQPSSESVGPSSHCITQTNVLVLPLFKLSSHYLSGFGFITSFLFTKIRDRCLMTILISILIFSLFSISIHAKNQHNLPPK